MAQLAIGNGMPSEVAKQTGMQKSTLEFWKAASTLWIVAAGMVAALFAAYLVFSHAGLRSANPSGDWAHHMALIDVLFNGEDVESRRPQLLIIADQPRWAHALAAWLAWATSLSPLRTIHIVAALAVILSVVVASARSVLVSLWVGRTGAGCVAGWLTGALTFWALTTLGAGFDGQIKYNFFFAQAVGTAAALLALTLVQLATGRGGRLAMSGLAMLALASVPLVTLILAKIHIVPALWFAAAGSVCALSLELKLLRRLGVAVLIGGTSALLLLADHSTRAIMQLGQAGRGSLIMHGWGALFTLNTDLAVIITGAALMAGLLILVALQGGPCSLRCRLFNLHAGAFAVLGLGALTLTALLFRGAVGYYALAKYVYLFGAEIALLTSHVAAAIARRSGAAFRGLGTGLAKLAWVALALVLTALAQHRWSARYSRDQVLLIAMRDALIEARPAFPSPAPYPLNEKLLRQERYYLFISAMAQPRDARALRLLMDTELGNAADAARETLPPSLVSQVVPVWSGGEMRLNATPPLSAIVFFGRWGQVQDFGRSTFAPAAHMTFRIDPAKRSQTLCLRLVAPPLRANAAILSTFILNGSPLLTETFASGGPDRVIGLPLAGVGPSGDVTVSIASEFTPTPARVESAPAAGLQAMWIAPDCK
jgi:hypothetical protein